MAKNDKTNDLKDIVSRMLRQGFWPSFLDVFTEAENQGIDVTLSTARNFFLIHGMLQQDLLSLPLLFLILL